MKGCQLIVITDLDGTLLNQEDRSLEASLPVIHKVRSLAIPLILCSSKTRAEMLPLWQELKLADPFIAENGAVICIPRGYFSRPVWGARHDRDFDVVELGTPIFRLRRVLEETARECDVKVLSFGAMSVQQVALLTGLSLDQAALAKQREYDEPFLLETGHHEQLFRGLRVKGFKVAQGDRFLHLTGNHDKGSAAAILVDLFRQMNAKLFTVGLGNSANDLQLLTLVDKPILVRNAGGWWDQEVVQKIPAIDRTSEAGSEGWREAMEEVLANAGMQGFAEGTL
jgi:mannosyl-3-phosphoglycerate phosphatase